MGTISGWGAIHKGGRQTALREDSNKKLTAHGYKLLAEW